MNQHHPDESGQSAQAKGAKNRLSRWIFRIPLYTLFCVVVLIGLGILVLQTAFVQDRLRIFIAETASSHLNATVSIGHVEGNLLSGLTLEEIRLGVPDTTTVLTIDSLSIRYLLSRMLFSTIHVEDLTVNGLRLDLEKSSTGDWNLPMLSNTSDGKAGEDKASFPFRVNVRRFNISDAKITARQGAEDTTLAVNRFSASLEFDRSIELSILDSSFAFNPPDAVQVSLSGDLAFDPAASDLTIDRFSIESAEARVMLSGNCRFSENEPFFSFSLTAPPFHLAGFSESFSIQGLPDAIASGTIHVSGTPDEFRHDLSLELDGASLKSNGAGGFDTDRGLWTELSAGIQTLELPKKWLPFNDILSGTASADIRMSATGLQSLDSIDANAFAELRGAAVSGTVLDTVRLSASWSHECLFVEQLSASSGQNRLNVSGSFTPKTLETKMDLSLNLPLAEVLLDPLSKHYPVLFDGLALDGQTDVAVSLAGALNHPSARFSITSRNIAFGSYRAEVLEIVGQSDGLPGAELRIDDVTLILRRISGDRFHASDLSLEGYWNGWLENPISRFSISSNDIAVLSYEAAHMDLKGLWSGLPGPGNRIEDVDLKIRGFSSDQFQAESLSLEGSWSGWLENPDAAFSIYASDLSRDQLRVAVLDLSGRLQGQPAADNAAADIVLLSDGIRFDTVDVQTLKLSANWQGPISAPSGHAAIEAGTAILFGERFTQLSLAGDVSAENAAFGLSANHENGSSAEIEGIVSPWRADRKIITINKVFVSTAAPWPESTLSNIAPLRFAHRNGNLTIDDCRLSVNEALLSLRGGLSPSEALELNLQADNLEIGNIPGGWNDIPRLSGLVSATATLNGLWNRPVISSDIRVTSLTGYDISQVTDLSATVDYTDTAASVHASLSRQGTPLLSGDARVPLFISLSPFFINTGSGDMEAEISSRNLRFSELPIPRINGIEWDAVADMNLSLTGSIQAPDMSGNIRIRDGELTLVRNKLTYETIEGSILFSNGKVSIENLLIAGEQEGRLMVTGAFHIRDGYDFDADLTLGGSRFYIPFQKAISARITPDLHLSGGLKAPNLTGEVTINECSINLDRLPRQQRSDIQVVESGTPDGDSSLMVASRSEGSDYLSPLSADILVRAPKNAWLKGQDVDAEISGEITVSKQPGEPFVLIGPLNTLRGNYYFMGKNFQLTKGSVDFLGLKEINPNLDIEAKTRIKSVDIIVALHGPAQEITIDLSSNPAMDESDIISYLVFGRASDNLSGDRAFSVEKAAMNYVGGLLAVELRDLLGGVDFIDTLSFDSASSENGFGSVTLGKYVTPEIFISHRQSLSENESSYQEITYELTPSIKLETQIGKDYSSIFDLTWEFDF